MGVLLRRIPGELLAAILAWLAVGLPVLFDIFFGSLPVDSRTQGWLAAWLAYGVGFFLIASRRLDHLSYAPHRLLLAVLSLVVVVALALLPAYRTTAILFILISTVTAYVLPVVAALTWNLAQALAVLLVLLANLVEPREAWFEAAAYLSFMLFAYVTTRSSLREAESKQALAHSNAELLATRHLLAESQRAAERVRIARELHDLVGHQLTALIVNLDVASRISDGKARETTSRAHQIAKALMTDVREAVRAIRDDEVIDLEEALSSLASNVPRPQIHLSLPEDLRIRDPRKGHALLRCVQEVITNSAKHADARNLWIEVVRVNSGVLVKARDDGRGVGLERDSAEVSAPATKAETAVPEDRAHGSRVTEEVVLERRRDSGPGTNESGLGLVSMKARLEALGGSLSIESRPGQGFAISAFVPGDEP